MGGMILTSMTCFRASSCLFWGRNDCTYVTVFSGINFSSS